MFRFSLSVSIQKQKMFKFTPDVSIPKQEPLDLVQMIQNRDKNVQIQSKCFQIKTKTLRFSPDLCTCQCACSCMNMQTFMKMYFVHVYVPIYVPASSFFFMFMQIYMYIHLHIYVQYINVDSKYSHVQCTSSYLCMYMYIT